MSTVLESLPERYRSVVADIVGQRDPELLASLNSRDQPTRPEREAVEEFLADALSEQFGPGHEPTDRGVLIENTIEAFLEHWPIESE